MEAEPQQPAELDALVRVTDAMLAHLEVDELLEELLERVAEVLSADTAAVLLPDETGRHLLVRAAKGLEEELADPFPIPVGEGFAGRIASERRVVTVEHVTADHVSPALVQTGIRSLLGAPLVVGSQVTGVLHVGTLHARRFSAADARILQLVADRAALALDHARAFERERSARAAAERAAARLEALARVTDTALTHLELDELLSALLERAREALEVDTAAILLLDESRQELVARAAKGLEEEVERGVRIPVGRGFAGRIASERRPIALERVDHTTVLNPILLEKGIRSLLGAPLMIEGRVLGVLHVGTVQPRRFSPDAVALLQRVADRTALALEHTRLYERERQAAEQLQRSLLPQRLPVLGEFAAAARYIPARHAAAVGGDWYDMIPLAAGRVGLAVGDVVGHGIAAASAMGELRSAMRAFALMGLEPAELIRRLDAFAWTLEPRPMATVIYVIVDADAGILRLASAGHPPPVLRTPGGEARLLEGGRSLPIGVSPWALASDCEASFERGATLLLYTDGVVERRDEPLEDRIERLRVVCERGPVSPDLLCDAIVAEFVDDASGDDVALLAVRPVPVTDDLTLELPAEPAVLASVRRAVELWLARAGGDREDVEAVRLACTEASANAIEHAYGPAPATFRVEGTFEGGTARIEVRDFGRWRAPRGGGRGRGLRFIEHVMDDVEVVRGAEGTVVRMSRRLHPARVEAVR